MSRSTFGKHDIKHNELKFYIHKIYSLLFQELYMVITKKKFEIKYSSISKKKTEKKTLLKKN